jgi:hypothetical protein
VGVRSALSRLFSGRTGDRRARRLEASGRLEEATALYLDAGQKGEAARLFLLRAEAAPDPLERLRLLGQARSLAEGEQRDDAARRRARLSLELVKAGKLVLVAHELAELAKELEGLGEPAAAAEAYARAGDVDGQARALVGAGAIEKLEQVLGAEQERVRKARDKDERERRVRDLELAGKRREALSLARRDAGADERLAALAAEIEARRVLGPRVRLEIDGETSVVLFGERVLVGRAGADLVVASPSVSREHLSIRRGSRGPEVIDEGSRNGTLLGGARIDVPVAVGSGVELMLGGDVPLRVAPWSSGVRIDVAGETLHAPLGALQVGSFELALGDDRWLELVAAAEPALLGGLRVEREIELCRGDEIRESAGGPARIRVIE